MIKIPSLKPKEKEQLESNHWNAFKIHVYKDLESILEAYKPELIPLYLKKIEVLDANKYNKLTYLSLDKIFEQMIYDLIIGTKPLLCIFKEIFSEEINNICKHFIQNKYKQFRSSWKEWNGYLFFKSLKVKVCPYCNINLLLSFKKENGQLKSIVQFDHYFPQDKHPLLALSLYNLVPCCSTCNHLKHNASDDLIYPYEESFDDYDVKFKISEKALFSIVPNLEDIEVFLDISQNSEQHISNSINILNLNPIYNEHTDEIYDILYNYRIYSYENLEFLRILLGNTSNAPNDAELKDIINHFNLTKEDYCSKSFSKLQVDIKNLMEAISIK